MSAKLVIFIGTGHDAEKVFHELKDKELRKLGVRAAGLANSYLDKVSEPCSLKYTKSHEEEVIAQIKAANVDYAVGKLSCIDLGIVGYDVYTIRRTFTHNKVKYIQMYSVMCGGEKVFYGSNKQDAEKCMCEYAMKYPGAKIKVVYDYKVDPKTSLVESAVAVLKTMSTPPKSKLGKEIYEKHKYLYFGYVNVL
jgi:hypothetical protein